MNTKCRIIVSCLLGLLINSPVFASVIASDSFETYGTGSGLDAANNGSGWTGAWSANPNNNTNVVSGGLSYNQGDISINGDSQYLDVTGIGNDYRLLSRGFTPTTGDVWFRLLFQQSVDASSGYDFITQ